MGASKTFRAPTSTINERIIALRLEMEQQGLDAYIIPSSDPHQSEYVNEHWKSREWISGFDGSAGTVIVTKDHATLWTDSRYFIQAESQLAGSEIVLKKQKNPHAPEHVNWLVEQVPERGVVGCDGSLFSVGQIRYLAKHFYLKQIEIDHNQDLIATIWRDRPALPKNEIFEYPIQYTGKNRDEKLGLVRSRMKKHPGAYYLVNTLDDIAWVLNIRSNDVAFNPVAICYLVIGPKLCYLFIDRDKVSASLEEQFQQDGIFLKPYDQIDAYLEETSKHYPILIDQTSISIQLYQTVLEDHVVKGKNIIRSLKAIKNLTEIDHIRHAMVKDGVALTKLFRWLESTLETKSISEYEVGQQLDQFRSLQGDYFGESFSAIVGYNSNGAIVHYRPEAESAAQIRKDGILLLDSGGQYINGTTDITRTVTLGKPTAEQKRNYTLVLKGHITLATTQFLNGTTGGQLDTLARMHLWKDGLNFGHGTGHGVGFFLNVHEPPQGFTGSVNTSRGATAIQAGMLTSNEPGFYKTGEYGIRIENLVLCVEGDKTAYGDFLKFETLTLFPIDTNLIELALLSQEEKQWLNDYHQKVFEKLAPHLEEEEKEWMRRKCVAID